MTQDECVTYMTVRFQALDVMYASNFWFAVGLAVFLGFVSAILYRTYDRVAITESVVLSVAWAIGFMIIIINYRQTTPPGEQISQWITVTVLIIGMITARRTIFKVIDSFSSVTDKIGRGLTNGRNDKG